MLKVLTTLGDELLESPGQRQLTSLTMSIKVRFGDSETLTRAYSHSSGGIDKVVFDRVLPYLLNRALAARGASPVDPQRYARPGVRLLGVSFSALGELVEHAPQLLEIDV